VGVKKTMAEYAEIDAEDPSLRRWKESLGIKPGGGTSTSAQRVVIREMALEVKGKETVVVSLENEEAVKKLRETPFTITEGSEYRIRVRFMVNNDFVTGLRYVQVVKRRGIKVDRMEEMMGSYAPNTSATPYYETACPLEEAPRGMLARGHYEAIARFMDDDKKTHLEFQWSFDITKQ